jgi:hypothetical protein
MDTLNFSIKSEVIEALQNYHKGATPKHDEQMVRCKREMAEMNIDISGFTEENITCLTLEKSGFLEAIIIPFVIDISSYRYQAVSEVMLNWLEYKANIQLQEQAQIKERMSSMLGNDTADSLLEFFGSQGKTLRILQ